MTGDPYSVLGVPSTATDDEVKRAYKALAKKYHPDLNPNNPTAEAKMKQINAAYDEITEIRSGKKTYTRQQHSHSGYTGYGQSYGNYTGGGKNYGGEGGYTNYGRTYRTYTYTTASSSDDPSRQPQYTRVSFNLFGWLRILGKILLAQLILSFLLRACSVIAAAPFRHTQGDVTARTVQTRICDVKEVDL